MRKGTPIGPYRIVKELGRGRMAIVYLVQGTNKRKRALKVLHTVHKVKDVDRIKREAKISRRLQHSSIVWVEGYKYCDPYHCLVMEYAEGQDLEKLIEQRITLPIKDMLQISWQICKALEYAHCKGVIHRDIKPQNVIVGRDNHVKVTDFGLATAASQSIATLSGFTGTPHYISPEQANGERGDERSDLYSLGVVIYQMLTGSVPFEAENELAVLDMHRNAQPKSILDIRPDVPDRLAWLVNKAMAKSPSDRFQTAQEMRLALEEVAKEQHISLGEKEAQEPLAKRIWADLAANLAANVVWVALTSGILLMTGITWGIWRWDVGELRAFFSTTKTVTPIQTVTPTPGRTPTKTPAPPTGTPTSSRTPTQTPVLATDIPTPTRTPTKPPVPSSDIPVPPPPNLASENRIVFASDRDGNGEIYVMNADGSRQTNLTNNPASDDEPAGSPDGKQIAFRSVRDGNWDMYVMDADGSDQTNRSNNSVVNTVHPQSWSPDGKRIVLTTNRDGNAEIYTMSIDGGEATRLTDAECADVYPAWSPDGMRIAFVSCRDGPREVYVMNADGSNVIRLTNGDAHEWFALSWSPDSKQITFMSNRDGNNEIYVMNADGSEQINLTNHPADDQNPAWSPDGQHIAFQSNRDGNWEIYVMNSDGSGQRNLTNNPAYDRYPAWLPR